MMNEQPAFNGRKYPPPPRNTAAGLFLESLKKFPERPAFYIKEKFYSYKELGESVFKIKDVVEKFYGASGAQKLKSKNVGLVAEDSLETYASIYALWLCGLTYVPLHPMQPAARNQEIIKQADIELLLNNGEAALPGNTADDAEESEGENAYILFTSGSTGRPKGVPISHNNLLSFARAFDALGFSLNECDRFLQPFDLTFDFSVFCYFFPVSKGACVYTVPHGVAKYAFIGDLLAEHDITFSSMVPSTIRFLRPYFSEINLPRLKYSLFCGEALTPELAEEWNRCALSAQIENFYGPTENTVFCSHYTFTRGADNKSHNGALSIGRAMSGNVLKVFDADGAPLEAGERGELCLAGAQLTKGYYKNPEKNKEAFFNYEGETFYRSGDICFMDEDGDFLYCGRADSQVKVQGYRIELGEIEHSAKDYLKCSCAACVTFEGKSGTEIALFIEGAQAENENTTRALKEHLKQKLPAYMLPSKIIYKAQLPLNANGKTDKISLKGILENE